MVGMGSIGQGVLPLIFRHIDLAPSQITIVTADGRGRAVAEEYGVTFIEQPLTRENYAAVLSPLLAAGDFLVNLSVEVSSTALIELCQARDVLYLDTCIEPWPGGYTDPSLSYSQRSNYGLRETALAIKRAAPGKATAVITHGANPGIVSYFVKQALLDVARDLGTSTDVPGDRDGWARLARDVGVKTIHIAERDTQVSLTPKRPGEFVNTWSIDGFVSEGCQPAELGWGTHERHFPHDGARHDHGTGASIYLMRPGASTRVRTWTPLAGPIHGFLITHNESISIADYYTLRDAGGSAVYRPTVHYAYHPCDDAVLSVHELGGRNWQQQERQRLMVDEVVSGIDELGVLLLGHARKAYWYGSRLTIDETRALVPHNNATSLQVTIGVLAGMVWAIENPRAGLVEADEIDHRRIFPIMAPYLGNLVGQYGNWSPLDGRGILFPEDIDAEDPWQFKNFRVV
ncbi:MAG: homospermidine synthase [Alphaproteobacteria bacterium]|nr:homospermidine synthase [Alphaproteobacteria bacterium]